MFDVRQPATLGQLTQLYMGNPNLTPTQIGSSLSMQPAGYIDRQGEALGLGNPTQYFQKQYDARKSAMQAGEAQAYAAQSGQAPARQAAPAPVASLQPRYSAASAMGDLAKAQARAQGLTDDQYNAMNGGIAGYGAYDQQRSDDNPQIGRERQAEINRALEANQPIPLKSYNYADPNNPQAVPQPVAPFVRGEGHKDFSVVGLNDLGIYNAWEFDAHLDAEEIDKVNKATYNKAEADFKLKPTHIVDYTTPAQFFNDRVFVRLMETNPDAAGKLFTHIMKRDMNEVIKERREMGVKQAVTAESRIYEETKAKQERTRAADLKIAADQLTRHNELRGRMEKGDYKLNNDTGKWQKKKLVPNKKAQEEEDALGTDSKTLATMIWSGEMEDLGTNDPTSEELTNAASPEHQKEILAIMARGQNSKIQAEIAARKMRMEEGLPDSIFNGMDGIAAMPTKNQIAYSEAAQKPGARGLRSFSSRSPIRLPWQSDPESQEGSDTAHGAMQYYRQFQDTTGVSDYLISAGNMAKGVANFFGGQWAKTPVDGGPEARFARKIMPANMGVRHMAPVLRDNKPIQKLLIEDRPRALAIIAALQTQRPEQMSPETLEWYNLIKK